jgi:myosin heavy subunit
LEKLWGDAGKMNSLTEAMKRQNDVLNKTQKAEEEAAEARRKHTQEIQRQIEAYSGVADKLTDVITKLQNEIDTFNMTDIQKEIWNMRKSFDLLDDKTKEAFGPAFEEGIKKVKELQNVLDEKKKAEEEHEKIMESIKKMEEEAQKMRDEGERIFQDNKTPMELYEDSISKLNKLLTEGHINWETYGRAVRKAKAELEASVEKPSSPISVGNFRSLQTSLVDIASLSIGSDQDPAMKKMDTQIGLLGEIKVLNEMIARKEGLS